MTDQDEKGQCGEHSERRAVSICRRCGCFLCGDCLFDIISSHCDPCTEVFLYSVKMPPRPMTKRSYIIVSVIVILVFLSLLIGLRVQGQSLGVSLFHGCLHSFFVGNLAIQFAQSYRAGKLNDKGREDFVEDYLMLMMRSKAYLRFAECNEADLNSVFEIDFESLELEDKLATLRTYCDYVEKALEKNKKKEPTSKLD
ncbi:MAG: hypothetical protein P1V97_29795 [Planctomycetota bacterium]|nr:hypothetical protein [Planctomycetota bacterium]